MTVRGGAVGAGTESLNSVAVGVLLGVVLRCRAVVEVVAVVLKEG